MALGAKEAFQRALREPVLKATWRVLGTVYLLAGASFLRQSIRNLSGGGLGPHLPVGLLLLWGTAVLLLLLVPLGFNRAQERSRHPWISLLDGAVFTVALSQFLWMWVLHPIARRAGLPLPNRIGVLLLFGTVAAALGLSFHVMAKRQSIRGPIGACAAALIWLMTLLPWWAKINFLQELRLAHPFRIGLLGTFMLLWLTVRIAWPPEAARRQTSQPWLMTWLPYLPAGAAFLGAFLHDLLFPGTHDRVDAVLLGSLAFLVLLRQVAAFHEIWSLKQHLEEKVEARTRELAESSRLLLRTQRMNLIATLGAGIAHDLNNLIGVALLNLDMLAPELQPPGAAVNPSLESLRSSLTKAGQLTQRLMGFGADNSREGKSVELTAHLRSLQPILRALVPHAISLDLVCSEEALFVPGNPGLIDQVVVNLVVNARDATPPGGRILVKAEVLPDSTPQPGWVCLSVTDTGVGIPLENLERIFEPFFSTKAAGTGTGLGLGSVKAVVENLGGRIRVQSSLGEGSCFTVHLSRVEPPPQPLSP
jgi:signal transduction histidine kinase